MKINSKNKLKVRKSKVAYSRLFASKKSMVFHIALVLLVSYMLVNAFIIIQDLKEDLPFEVGVRQYSLMQTYHNFYAYNNQVERTIDTFIPQIYIDLADSGGIYAPSGTSGKMQGDCGSYFGFQYWQSPSQDLKNCAATSQLQSFEHLLREKQSLDTINIVKMQTQNYTTQVFGVSQTPMILTKDIEGAIQSVPFREYYFPESYEIIDGKFLTPPFNYIYYDDTRALQATECDPKSKTFSYDLASKMYHYTNASCIHMPQSIFRKKGIFVSIINPELYHLKFSDPKDNIMTKELAEHLIALGDRWYDDQCKTTEKCSIVDTISKKQDCCLAALEISSIASLDFAPTSQHNIANAVDIAACYNEKDQASYAIDYYYGSGTARSFEPCYNLIKDYYETEIGLEGSFIGPKDCIGKECLDRDLAHSLIHAYHFDHIYLTPRDPFFGSD